MKRKRNLADSTLRNVRAANKKLHELLKRILKLERRLAAIAASLFEKKKTKRVRRP